MNLRVESSGDLLRINWGLIGDLFGIYWRFSEDLLGIFWGFYSAFTKL